MLYRSLLAAAMTLALLRPARASSVSNEFSVSSSKATTQSPRAGYASDWLNGSFDVDDQWSISLGATLTFERSTPAPPGSAFATKGGTVALFSAGIDFDPTEHFTVGLFGEFSPESRGSSSTSAFIESSAGPQPVNLLLDSTSSNASIGVSAGYDSGGDSNFEWSLTGGVTGTHLETNQSIGAVQGLTGGVATTNQVFRYCQTHFCPRSLLRLISAQSAASLDSAKLSLAGTITIAQDTDLTLGWDYYRYQQDPTQLGYFSVLTAGRAQMLGGGVPIAPLRYVVRPELTQRFGAFSARIWAQGGEYVSGAGQTTGSVGLKLEYKFTKAFRMWLSGSGQRDVDAQGDISRSGTVAVGGGYKF